MINTSLSKVIMPEQPAKSRIENFEEVSLGYSEEQALEEASRCLNCKNPACMTGCPVGVPIPSFISMIKEKKYIEAAKIIKNVSALPAICGRVCPQEHQCESKCARGIKGQPVGIGRLERFVADRLIESEEDIRKKQNLNGYKIAVIGSGPSGLTCAGDLALMGYSVTVFEALHKFGGILTYGIPEFVLPKKIVNKEIEMLKNLGVEFVPNFILGKSATIDDLLNDGFEAIYIGIGASHPSFMGIPGENLKGVCSANEYLMRINLMNATMQNSHTPMYKAKKIAVIGGGNVAIDAARCALRTNADEVSIIYRRSEAELPSRLEDIRHAKEEGVIFKFLTNPTEILSDSNGNVCGIKCVSMELGEPDASGRRRPIEISGSDFVIDADLVIMAIGTSASPLVKNFSQNIELNNKGYFSVNENGQTSMPPVFAGGDAVTGPATVIKAMGAGKKSAKAIDEYIKSLSVSK